MRLLGRTRGMLVGLGLLLAACDALTQANAPEGGQSTGTATIRPASGPVAQPVATPGAGSTPARQPVATPAGPDPSVAPPPGARPPTPVPLSQASPRPQVPLISPRPSGLLASGDPSTGPVRDVPYAEIERRSLLPGALLGPGNARIRSQEALSAFYARILFAVPPSVDFVANEVLAFFEPGGETGCEAPLQLRLSDTGREIVPLFLGGEFPLDPPEECEDGVQETGYRLVRMPRTDLPVRGITEYSAP